MLESLVELEQICLVPADSPNFGNINSNKVSFNVVNPEDNSQTLPIFTAPLPSVISSTNYQAFYNKGIRPVLPRTEPIETRLDGCQYIFCAFTLGEIQEHFLQVTRRSDKLFRVCIENGNGHDVEIFNVSIALKRVYGNQISVMAGNIGNAKIYIDYCKAGIDYVRVGLASGSMVNDGAYGFHYPMASLLLDINGVRNTSCAGLRHTKIVADGGIITPVDILKAMAVGADYVMIGRSFVKLAEAAGPAFIKEKDGQIVDVDPNAVVKMGKSELLERKVLRLYAPISDYEQERIPTPYDSAHNMRRLSEASERTVNVISTLQMWTLDMYDVFHNAFVMAKALNWRDYKTNIRFVKRAGEL